MCLFKLVKCSLLQAKPEMYLSKNHLHTSTVCCKIQAGRYKRSVKGDKPLTYEMAMRPESIAHTKSWNSWNTS